MAKKIRIEDYKRNKKAIQKSNYKKDIIKIASLITNGVLVIALILLIVMHFNIKSRTYSWEEYGSMLDKKNSEISDLKSDLDRVLGGKSVEYIEDKLNLMDEDIVFQIEGYGNKYYTYDCVMKKVGEKPFSYWAYNKDAARVEGLKKGSC